MESVQLLKNIGIPVPADGEADGAAVGGADDIALHIRAEYPNIGVPQTAQGLIVGMTVGIALTAGDDAVGGHDAV